MDPRLQFIKNDDTFSKENNNEIDFIDSKIKNINKLIKLNINKIINNLNNEILFLNEENDYLKIKSNYIDNILNSETEFLEYLDIQNFEKKDLIKRSNEYIILPYLNHDEEIEFLNYQDESYKIMILEKKKMRKKLFKKIIKNK